MRRHYRGGKNSKVQKKKNFQTHRRISQEEKGRNSTEIREVRRME